MTEKDSQNPNDGSGQPAKTKARVAGEKNAKLASNAREEGAVVRQNLQTALQRGNDSIIAHLSMKPIWVILAFAALITIMFLPQPEGLSTAGQSALAILAFAVIMWVTEAVSYPVSAIMILGLIALLMGFSPDPDNPGEILGTSDGLGMALGGFSSSAVALVAAALALAAAMQSTGLHKRLAFLVMKFAGEKTSNILIGAIVISIVLAFFVPSATARAGAVVPILIGMVVAFGLPLQSKLGALLIITSVQAVSIWNVGIKTGAAQNLVGIGFIESEMGVSISWPQWLLYAGPWSLIMSVILFFIMRWVIKPEVRELKGGKKVIAEGLSELGPMTGKEKRLTIIAVLLLLLWATEGSLHPLDSSTITLVAVAFMLIPKIGVFSWKSAEELINWGTLIVFAIGISLGTVLLDTGGAEWLSEKTFASLGLENMPLIATIALVSLFNILIHLGFASATSLASALIPVFIALAISLPYPDDVSVGFVVIQQFVISFGFLLPISAPQNMLAYGTGAFSAKQFLKAGIPLTVAAYLLVILFSATYWKWVGLV